MKESKSLPISKQMVWQAYRKVKANKGSAGVDGQSIETFDADMINNLYKLWNRLASGSYFPPAVKEVEIPKGNGKVRKLGIATVSDRIAQTVVKDYLEAFVEPMFHPCSFGYRPGRSAHQALEQATLNCRRFDMVIDLDIEGFFDEIDHELLMAAVRKHTKDNWVLMYIERWLKAPVQRTDGTLVSRERGTPQGSCVSPLLANLFLHYCFDRWMEINFSTIRFERYVDDVIVHCVSPEQAGYVLSRIVKRMTACKLRVHPEKTKIVYCRDSNRYKREHDVISFTFLGYTFRPRLCKTKQGNLFYSFTPAISREAVKKINTIVKEMQIHRMVQTKLEVIASMLNPRIRGWINYYGKFRKSEMQRVFYTLNNRLFKWVRCKFKQHRYNIMGAINWLRRVTRSNPDLFVHWQHGFKP